MKIINDVHLGVTRRVGTTPESSKALSNWVLEEFKKLISQSDGDDLIILGDLFDKYRVDSYIEKEIFACFYKWCKRNPSSSLVVVRGNHDYHTDSEKMGSLDLLMSTLSHVVSNIVYVKDEVLNYNDEIFIVPHLANQDLFDTEISLIPDKSTVFLHCNYDNFFATASDHSLNLTPEQAKRFDLVIIGHEHTSRSKDNVIALGNQWPTSIADCTGDKFYCEYNNDELIPIRTWSVTDNFAKVNCDSEVPEGKQFVKIEGEVMLADYPKLIHRVSNIRKKSNTFVISLGVDVVDTENQTIERVTTDLHKFNAMEELMSLLTPQHKERINALREI